MHETRNFALIVTLVIAMIWALVAWLVLDPESAPLLLAQRTAALVLLVGGGAWLFYGMVLEDRLPDHLNRTVGPVYYEADGLSFMPTIRVHGEQAELCIFYQNRFENPVEAIVQMRLPEDCFIVRDGMQNISFAFRASGGDFGVIRQPIAVPRHLQGDVVNLQLAAATYYPRSHGTCWRRKPGMSCGTFPADFSGSVFKSGVHEGANDIKLSNPASVHLAMPIGVHEAIESNRSWRQEQISAGEVEAAA